MIVYFTGTGNSRWCAQCMACLCLCPAQAVEYGRGSVGKRRCRGPEHTG